MGSNEEIIKKIRKFFEDEELNKNSITNQFSKDVIDLAYQKLSEQIKDNIQSEEDPIIINELLNSYLNVTKAINEQGLANKQLLLKLFEQLTKYEQGKYY